MVELLLEIKHRHSHRQNYFLIAKKYPSALIFQLQYSKINLMAGKKREKKRTKQTNQAARKNNYKI